MRLLLAALFLLAVTACSHSTASIGEKEKNLVTETKLTEREKTILSSLNDKVFVFDYKLSQPYKKTSIWIEKYDNGKKGSASIGKISTAPEKKNGQLIVSLTNMNSNIKGMRPAFKLAIGGNGGSVSNATEADEPISLNMSTVNPKSKIVDGKELILAGFFNGNASLSASIFEDAEKDPGAALAGYGTVYLVKCTFSN
ncbi:hypothetical protein [Bacillus testis]|uniref:hypothetical protein n=1 Tax=Bacillus testis TaxID=1622072 RepID=UPI0011C95C67|nr:hypothetical protein [Bacillus testis]